MTLLRTSPDSRKVDRVAVLTTTSRGGATPPNPPSGPDHRPKVPPHVTQRRSEGIKLRRSLTFLGMTLLLPGAAQMAAGNRTVGRIAVRIWAGLWVLAVVGVLFGLIWPAGAVTVFTVGPVLVAIQIAIVLVGLGWVVLVLDAWRISRPPELAPRHRLGVTVLNLLVVGLLISGLVTATAVISTQRDLVTSVFAGGGNGTATNGRLNVLLLGGDAGKDRVGLRPDSLTVASVDVKTGRSVLIGLPRNLERVPFPDSSPLHAAFPEGFYCADRSCLLNAVYTYATNHRELYPGVTNPGAQATTEAVEGATGLKINYWVLVDLRGFEQLVDAVGGITMDVYRRVPIGGGSAKIYGYVEAGRQRHLNGREALWFARSRSDSSDYDRMVRQKCVMNAMLNQLDPFTVLTKFNAIAAAGKEILATNIPTADLDTMVRLALAAKKLPVASVNFVPPLVEPTHPDFSYIRDTVAAKIGASEHRSSGRTTDGQRADATTAPTDSGQPSAGASASQPGAGQTSTGASTSSAAGGQPSSGGSRAPEADDLTQVCAA
jgi:polyisoprenyl-teichoic acid--peptidoglycan teichoic acid transferase